MQLKTTIEKLQNSDISISHIPYVRYELAEKPWTHKRVFGIDTIIFPLDGICHVECNGNKYTLSNKNILYVKEGYLYTSTEHTLPVEYIMIEFETIKPPTAGYELKEFYEPSNPEKFHELAIEMYRQFNTVETASFLKLKRTMYDILIELSKEDTDFKNDYYYKKIRKSIEHLNENVFKKYIDVEELANISGLSISQFNRIFKSIFHRTPTKYMNTLRIERGKKLLSETTQSVALIAETCGFSSTYYFSKLFKAETGLSPLQYRISNLK